MQFGLIMIELSEIGLKFGEINLELGQMKLESMEIVKESGEIKLESTEIKLESRGKNGTHTISYNYIGFIGFNYSPSRMMEIVQV